MVARPSNWRWASAASARENTCSTLSLSPPDWTQSRTSVERFSSSFLSAHVVGQPGAGEVEGSRAQTARVHGRRGAAGLSVQHHVAAAGQAADALVEGGLANGIVHHVDALAVGGALDLLSEVLLGCTESRGRLRPPWKARPFPRWTLWKRRSRPGA